MGLFRRKPPSPPALPLPLRLPRLGGDGGWPSPAQAPRSFEASTYYELGSRRAFEADAHGVGQAVVDAALPLLETGVTAEDEPYLRGVFTAAARTGAGLALVESDQTASASDEIDPSIAAALWQARRSLPAMREDWARAGAWFVLAGHYAARCGPSGLARLLAGLSVEEDGSAEDSAGPTAQDEGQS